MMLMILELFFQALLILLVNLLMTLSKLDIVQTGYVRQVECVDISDEYSNVLDKDCFLFAILDD